VLFAGLCTWFGKDLGGPREEKARIPTMRAVMREPTQKTRIVSRAFLAALLYRVPQPFSYTEVLIYLQMIVQIIMKMIT